MPPPTVVPGTPFSGPVDPDAAEKRWCAYAWPVAPGNSGQRVFFVDQDGEVWQCANQAGAYGGPSGGPAWDAAMPASGPAGWTSMPPKSKKVTGRDGNVWVPVN